MKNKIIHFLRYVNKFGILKAIQIYYKTRLTNSNRSKLNIFKEFSILLRPKTSDIYVFDLVFLWDEYGRQKYINKINFIIDLGANIGLTTLYFHKEYPEASIIGVEPENSNFEILRLNTKHIDKIQIYNKAIWNKKTKISLINNITNDNDGYCFGRGNDNNVETITINELLKNSQYRYIDILKIDIEGGEKNLFYENYENWLPFVRLIIIELHDLTQHGASKNVFKAIGEYNFDIVFKNKESVFCINRDIL